MQVYIKANRRSMVPYMAAFSLLSYLQSVEDEADHREKAKEKAKEMYALLGKYRRMKKKSWGKQDLFAFRVYKSFTDYETRQPWTLVELVLIIVLQIRITWWMSMAQLESLQAQLTAEFSAREKAGKMTDDARVEYYLCLTEFEMHKGNSDKALDCAAQGLSFEKGLSKEGRKEGAVPMIHYMAAMIHANRGDLERAKAGLKRLRSYGTHYAFHALIFLKAIVLAQKLGEDFVQDYEQLSVGARTKESAVFQVASPAEDRPIEWSWYVEKHTIRFRAAYVPVGQGEPILIQSIGQHDSENKHVIGEYKPTQPGKLELTWDNAFSRLRSKSVHFKVNIPEVAVATPEKEVNGNGKLPN